MKDSMIFFDLECVYDENHKQDLKSLIEKYGEEKTNFLPEINKILTICVGFISDDGSYKIKGLDGTEEEQIKLFFGMAEKYDLCGFNIQNFDLPFIIKRALGYGIRIPNQLKIYGKKSREITNILDLQEVYRLNVWGAIGNLDMTCKYLGITSPKEEGISGKDIQMYHDTNRDKEIINYCIRDVEACMKLYERFILLNLI